MNLFLTGERHAGKSTLIRKWVEEAESPGGFVSVKCGSFAPGAVSVHLLDVSRREEPSGENLLFICRDCGEAEAAGRFNALGPAALKNARGAGLIVMDELGPHEEAAEEFKKAVFAALDGDAPVVGVIQRAESAFLDAVRNHPKTVIIEVTSENRSRLFRKTLDEALEEARG